MSQEKPKVLGIVVYLPVDLALEMYRESGNLSISDFPYILKFAESIEETLNVECANRIEEYGNVVSAIICKEEKKLSLQQKHHKR